MVDATPSTTRDCRMCGQHALEIWFELQRSPRNISRLLTAENLKNDKPIRLPILRCGSCGFVQVEVTNQSADYDEYTLSWMHIKTLRDYREQLATDFKQRLSSLSLPVLDVGCGSGDFLKLLSERGVDAIGIEPSRSLVEIARSSGYKVIHDYVRPESLEGLSLGGFTCLQVLEHLDSPVSFLKTLREALSVKGVGVIEVPSLEKITEGRRFYDFFGDHLNYFNARSLRMCCELAGFDVLKIERRLDGQFLAAYVTPSEAVCAVPAGDSFFGSLPQLRHWAAGQLVDGKKLVFWGAGYKSIAAIAEMNLSGIECVVDSDPLKAGKFMPVSHLEIKSPESVDFTTVDAVILVAVAYREEIVLQLRERIGFSGVIVACGDQLEFL
ncbi:MAG: methyltransferase domain-containing protein [Verrucomicrobiota bacterium]